MCFFKLFFGVHKELVIELLNLKIHFPELEKSKMKFIAQLDKLRMAHLARE